MDPGYAETYSNYESNHWWFKARRRILRSVLLRLPLPERPRILEIGTGPGGNLYSIYPPGAELHGLEPNPELAQIAHTRGSVPVAIGHAEELPEGLDRFDVVTLLDVLEHTSDDGHVCAHLAGRLVPGGRLLLTVPAYMFLWSAQDVVSGHYRRYTRNHLARIVERAGLVCERITYFNTLLFPAVALFRITRRLLRGTSGQSDLRYSFGTMDKVLYRVFASERRLLNRMNLPFGVSILLIARKPDAIPPLSE